MAEVRKRGWHPDPFGIHHERFYFADDEPGRLVRDETRHESFADLPGDRPPEPPRPGPRDLTALRVPGAPDVDEAEAPPSTAPTSPAGAPATRVFQQPPPTEGAEGWIDAPATRWNQFQHRVEHLPRRTMMLIGSGSLAAVVLLVVLIVITTSSPPKSAPTAGSVTTVARQHSGTSHHGHASASQPTRTLPTSVSPSTVAPGNVTPTVASAGASTIWQVTQSFHGASLGLNGVSCPSATVCEAVGETTLVTDMALRSTDAGATWVQQSVPPVDAPLTAVDCPSVSTCFALGATTLLKTTDGGATWKASTLGNNRLAALSCRSDRVCMAAGQAQSSNSACATGAAYATTNGGASWTTSLVHCFVPTGISCSTSTICELVGAQQKGNTAFGAIYGTSNEGFGWVRQYLNSAHGSVVTAINCPTVNQCHAVGNAGINSDLRTINGGGRWFAQSVPASAWPRYYVAVNCFSTLICQATGNAPPIVTENAGENWSLQTMPSQVETMTGVSCPTTRLCVGVATSLTSGADTLTLVQPAPTPS